MQQCIPYADQTDAICGTGGMTCSACADGKYCNGSGGCNNKTWCQMQTVPSGVDLADYQCVDFDNGSLPTGWTLTQTAGGVGEISSTQASSTPNSFHSSSVVQADTVATLSWSRVGTKPVTMVDLAVNVFRPVIKGDPGPWTGYHDEACAAVGNARACLSYRGAAGFGVAFSNGMTRVDCGTIMDVPMGVWTPIDLQIGSHGQVELWASGSLMKVCDNGGASFPTSNTGSAAVGIARTEMTVGGEMYFDNVVVSIQR